MASYQYHFHCKNVFINKGPREEREKRAPLKRKWDSATKPADLPKICRYQERCQLGEDCKFYHLDAADLEGCRRPYNLCWRFPHCSKEKCPYVHWRPKDGVAKRPKQTEDEVAKELSPTEEYTGTPNPKPE